DGLSEPEPHLHGAARVARRVPAHRDLLREAPEGAVSELTRRRFLGAAGATALGACAAAGARAGSAPRGDAGARAGASLDDLANEVGPLPPFPSDAHAERRERLYEAMRRRQIGACLLGPTLNLRYFTGGSWGASERLFGCVLFADRPPVWIAPAFEE